MAAHTRALTAAAVPQALQGRVLGWRWDALPSCTVVVDVSGPMLCNVIWNCIVRKVLRVEAGAG